jgi:hypothetical protein
MQNYAIKFVIIFVEFISLKKYSLDAYDNLWQYQQENSITCMPENLASRFSNLIFFKVELIATKKAV